jgi:hypothetical protein
MSSTEQVIQDPAPFLASTGVAIGADGSATVTGAVTVSSKPFFVGRMRSFTFAAQGTGTGVAATSGTPATGWKIFAAQDRDSTRPGQAPGVFVDVTADFGSTVGGNPSVGVKQFGGAFSGTASDRMSSPVCPYAWIQFQLAQQSGTENIKGQFFAGTV